MTNKNNILKRTLVYLLTLCMIVGLFPGITLVASATDVTVTSAHQNTNQGDGVTLMKKAEPKADGSVDISIGAYTTGEVVSHTTSTPTDIVLVLDVSGSMADPYESVSITDYYPVTGEGNWVSTGFLSGYYRYGLSSTTGNYYIKTSEDKYVPVTYVGMDNNNCDYYTDGSSYYYPIVNSRWNDPENNYPVVQVYSYHTQNVTKTKIQELKESANAFIDDIAARNSGVAQASQHRIAIVTYAGSSSTVQALTYVNGDTVGGLKTSVNGLNASGATRIDYGMERALNILQNNSTNDGQTRKEVVIAFTDGVPTESSAFNQNVAGNAVLAGADIKSAKGTIFTISMAPGADATASIEGVTSSSSEENRTNQFMHFLSSNFPNSSYSNSVLSAGTSGSINNGYYMTTDDTTGLEQIFDKISTSIGTPTIELGSDATLIDSVSSYFKINPGLDLIVNEADVSVKTVAKTADGWAQTGETATGVTVSFGPAGSKSIVVSGFDFDANYVSETPRDGDNYGKMLLIEFNVLPEELAIDNANASLNGLFPTNNGNALIRDSNISVAEVITPELQLPKITYQYTVPGQNPVTYKTIYRLPGTSDIEILGDASLAGYTFSGWETPGNISVSGNKFTMPNEDVLITGTFTLNKHNVIYKYSDEAHATAIGATDLSGSDYNGNAANTDVPYNSLVTVAPIAEAEGYAFSGWYPQQTDVRITEGKFAMPDKDVVLLGYFTAKTNTPYKVHHYLMNEDGTYDETSPVEVETGYGTTGQKVVIQPDTTHEAKGFKYDLAYSLTKNADNQPGDTAVSGTIAQDGSLIVKLYYSRNKYNVTYELARQENLSASALAAALPLVPTDADSPYYHGAEVSVNDDPISLPGYTFVPWHPHATDGQLDIVDNKFVMPNRDVTLYGYFEANDNTPYTIEHYVQKTDLSGYETTPYRTRTATGITDSKVTVSPLPEIISEGFVYNLTYSLTQNDGNQPGDEAVSGIISADGLRVIKLYYDRPAFNVTYEIEGAVPTGFDHSVVPVDAENPRVFGSTVRVAAPLSGDDVPDGYTFVGWYRGAATQENIVTEFVMPAHPVTILGHFEPKQNGTPYKVHHYLMDENGSYPATDNPSITETFMATIGDDVEAKYLTTYLSEGYDPDSSRSITNGRVTAEADGILILELYYEREKYDVTYELARQENLSASALADALPIVPTDLGSPYYHGAEVSVKAPISLPGYTFVTWHPHATDSSVVIDGGKFTMPMRDVTLYGYFTPNHNTPYTIEHYVQKTDLSGYETTPYRTRTATGITDSKVTVSPLPEIISEGFVYNLTYSLTQNDGNQPGDEAVSGIISADGLRVIKLYYDRPSFNVTYEIEGVIPEDFDTNVVPVDTNLYPYDSTVWVEPKLSGASVPIGYTFVGWYRGTDANPVGASLSMPAHNVLLLGRFVPNENTPYYVKHYLQKLDATGNPTDEYELDTKTASERFGTTGTSVWAQPLEFAGYEYILAKSTPNGTIAGDGTTVLEFYYDRLPYKVKYEFTTAVPHAVTDDADWIALAANNPSNFYYGANVNLYNVDAEDYVGYAWSGWETDDAVINGAAFSMPDNDVYLTGGFAALERPYIVRHYKQTLDGESVGIGGIENKTFATEPGTPARNYSLAEEKLIPGKKTGAEVVAVPFEYVGFTQNQYNDEWTGRVAGDENNPLVLCIYYDRNLYDIEYKYYSDCRAADDINRPNLNAHPYKVENVPFGKALNVEADLTLAGYTFDGWYSSTVNLNQDGSYEMTNSDVVFLGRFLPNYTVKYNLNGGNVGGSTTVSDKTGLKWNDTNLLYSPNPTKSGYSFAGWKYGDETVTNEHTYGSLAIDTNIETIILVAQWSSNTGGGGGGGVTQYTLTYESNGGTKYSPEKYNSGKTVDIDKEPIKNGYDFNGWYLDEELTERVTSVKMTKDITVYAAWNEIESEVPGSLNGDDHFAYVIGYTDGTVRPNANITRAEVAAIFFRLLKDEARDANLTDANDYADVSKDDWHNKAISTLTKLGIVEGKINGRFAPDDYITRAEFATIAARFDDSAFEIKDNFSDVSGHWAEAEIHEAAAHGWIRGYEDNTFKPDQIITRAEAMTLINRVLNRLPETVDDLLSNMVKWPDNSNENEWYYIAVQEATNSHEYDVKNKVHEKWTKLTTNRDWAAYQK